MNEYKFVSGKQLVNILDGDKYTVIVFGTTIFSQSVSDVLVHYNVHIDFYADNDKNKWRSKFNSIEIIDPNAIINLRNPLVILASSYYEQMYEQLVKLNVKNIYMINNFVEYPFAEVLEERKLMHEYFENIEEKKSGKILIRAFDGLGDNIIKLGLYKYILKKVEKPENIYFAVYKKPVYEMLKLLTDNVIYFDKKDFIENKTYRMNMLEKIYSYYFDYSVNFATIRLTSRHGLLYNENLNIDTNYENYDLSNDEYVLESQVRLAKNVFGDEEFDFSPKYILDNKIKEVKLEYNLPEKYVCVGLGTEDTKRICPKDIAIAILKNLSYKDNYVVLLGNGNKDDQFYAELLEELDNNEKIINLSSQCSIVQTFKIMSNAKAYIGIDSGLAHAAYILDREAVIIIGGGHLGKEKHGKYMHNDKKIKYITNKLECFGCGWLGCSSKETPCIKGIKTKDVINAIDELNL